MTRRSLGYLNNNKIDVSAKEYLVLKLKREKYRPYIIRKKKKKKKRKKLKSDCQGSWTVMAAMSKATSQGLDSWQEMSRVTLHPNLFSALYFPLSTSAILSVYRLTLASYPPSVHVLILYIFVHFPNIVHPSFPT
jgi:hypothetical protein